MQKRGFHRFSRTHLTFFWAGHHHFDLASQVLVSTDEGILDVQHSGRIGQTVSPSLYLYMSRNAIYVEATNPADNQIEKQITNLIMRRPTFFLISFFFVVANIVLGSGWQASFNNLSRQAILCTSWQCCKILCILSTIFLKYNLVAWI